MWKEKGVQKNYKRKGQGKILWILSLKKVNNKNIYNNNKQKNINILTHIFIRRVHFGKMTYVRIQAY